ncbi:hypothetical protein ABZY16_03740 [Streptomyces sp. NPDC006553]|uniref:hypothetical protein n=1 Tax=unclassified Streptomyces TaxID=2593676 RepID=UPI002254EBFE|nr:hypothetical protein [Streptomyces sp. NBC_00233]MCX5226052.1 hypothetical protein [Streptomyces sp. NBC_00233]
MAEGNRRNDGGPGADGPLTTEGDTDSGGRPWSNWAITLATLLAPTTFIGALLLYFGFAYTSALYAHFRVDAATLGFSTQDYALRSAGPLFVPAGIALTVALVAVLVYYAARALGARGGRLPPGVRFTPYLLSVCGLVLFALGMLGGLGAWDAGAMDTPLLLGCGLVLVVFGRALVFKLSGADYPVARERLALALVAALVGLSSFWAVQAYAKQYGDDDARYLARNLWLRPAVTVDTAERLYFLPGQARETVLPVADHPQRFRYRYEGLRLLAEVNGRMFLIPENWSETGGSVLVIPANGAVRVAFRAD